MESKLTILEKRVARKEEIEELLNAKLQPHKLNAPGMELIANRMRGCAVKAAEDAEVILQYANILEEMEDDQEAEMAMYGHISE